MIPTVLMNMKPEAMLLADVAVSLGMVGQLSHDGRLMFEVAKRRRLDVLDGIGMIREGTSEFWSRWKSGPIGDLLVHYWKKQVAGL